MKAFANGLRLHKLKPRIDWLACKGEHAEDAFVNAAKGFLSDEAFQAFEAQCKFAQVLAATALHGGLD